MFDRRLMLSFLDGLITESERKQLRKVEQLRAKGTPEAEAAAKSIETRRGERFERVRQARVSGEPVASEKGRKERTERAQERASTSARREATADKLSKDFSAVLKDLSKIGKVPTTLKGNLENREKANKIEATLKKVRDKVAAARKARRAGEKEAPRRSVRKAMKSEDNN